MEWNHGHHVARIKSVTSILYKALLTSIFSVQKVIMILYFSTQIGSIDEDSSNLTSFTYKIFLSPLKMIAFR